MSLEDRTENRVSDGNTYTYPQTGEDEPDAAIFSKDDVVFEGNGMLTVSGNYMNGIQGKDCLTINSGTYVIEAAEDGMKGKDAVEVNGGEITITAGSDGIQSNNNGEEDKGICRESPEEPRPSQQERKEYWPKRWLRVTGGIIDINAQDDGIHSGKNVRLFSGELTLSAGDDTVHSDNLVEVSGGTIIVEQSREGLEGLCLEITGGTIQINSEDDGINAALGYRYIRRSKCSRRFFWCNRRGLYPYYGRKREDQCFRGWYRLNGDLYLREVPSLAEGPAEGEWCFGLQWYGNHFRRNHIGCGSAGMFQTFF